MTNDAFSELLAQRRIPSVLLFEGEEDYLKQTAFAGLRKALLPEGLEDLNESILEAPEPAEIIAAAETLPFMADRRLIVIRDYPPLVGRPEADEQLLTFLAKAPPSSVILFYCIQKPGGKKKLYSLIRKLNGIVSFEPLKNQALTSFVIRAFQEQGKSCDQRTADFLIFTSGSDSGRLMTEIAKIASYHADNPAVSVEDIRTLATPSLDTIIFRLTDAVCAGQSVRAMTILRDLMLTGERPDSVLAVLLRQFRLLQHIKIMQYEKRTRAEIASALGFSSSYVTDSYLRQASGYNGRQVREAVALCLGTEMNLKTGAVSRDGAVEALVLKLLALRSPQ